MNVAYQAMLSDERLGHMEDVVRRDAEDLLRATQPTWLDYRREFRSMVRRHYPEIDERDFSTWMTIERTKLMDEMPLPN
jgi:uncharacterized protein YecT (DUF1311 family)